MIRLLTRVFCLAVIVGLMVSISQAQDAEKIIRPMTKSGSVAAEFAFGGLESMSMPAVELAAFLFPGGEGTGSIVPILAGGGKYYLSDDLALRALVAFSTNTEGDPDPTKSPNGKTTGTTYGINAGIEMHTRAVYSVSPYFGAQLLFAGGSSDNTKNVVDVAHGKNNTTLATTTQETKYSATGFGIGVMAGFDWYVFNAVAVGAEYSLAFASISSSATSGGTTTDLPTSTAIGIGAADIHLLIHF